MLTGGRRLRKIRKAQKTRAAHAMTRALSSITLTVALTAAASAALDVPSEAVSDVSPAAGAGASAATPTDVIPSTEEGSSAAEQDSGFSQEQLDELRRKAEAGDAASQSLMGDFCYAQMSSEDETPTEAMAWYRKAADQGLAEAQVKLAICCEALGTAEGDAEAVALLRRAADQNYAHALYLLAYCYLEGVGVPASNILYFAYLHEAAAQGSNEACCSLGSCYEFAIGTAEDKAAALKWYRKGAEGGDAEAAYNVAICLEYGTGTEADPAEAFRMMRQAYEGGYAPACAALALYYREGVGTEVNEQKALEYIREGAEAGDPTSLLYRGLCFAEGLDEVSAEEAYRCFSEAAEQGYYEGFVFMSIMLRYGVGTAGDAQQAQDCYERAVLLASDDEAFAVFSSDQGFKLDERCATLGYDTMAEEAAAPSAEPSDAAAGQSSAAADTENN